MSKLRLIHLIIFFIGFIGLLVILTGNIEVGLPILFYAILASIIIRVVRWLWRD